MGATVSPAPPKQSYSTKILELQFVQGGSPALTYGRATAPPARRSRTISQREFQLNIDIGLWQMDLRRRIPFGNLWVQNEDPQKGPNILTFDMCNTHAVCHVHRSFSHCRRPRNHGRTYSLAHTFTFIAENGLNVPMWTDRQAATACQQDFGQILWSESRV